MLAADSVVSTATLVSLFWVTLALWLAPILSSLTRHVVPGVVILLLSGVLLGPHALGLASSEGGVDLLAELGLGLLFLLAGFELEVSSMTGRGGRRATATWFASWLLASGVGWLVTGQWETAVAIGLLLTSTAVGTLLPILKDGGHLRLPVGRAVVTHGAVGELGPVLVMAVLLGSRSVGSSIVALGVFLLAALFVVLVPPRLMRIPVLRRALREGATSTSQTAMRSVILLLAGMMAIAAVFQLDVVLGAFAAGIILRHLVSGIDVEGEPDGLLGVLLRQLETVGYSLFIPVFFVVSGMAIDVNAVTGAPWLLLLAVVSILVIRGGGVWLAERVWRVSDGLDTAGDRVRVGLYAATGLPIIVAVTDVAVDNGLMTRDLSSVLVAAGGVTVLLFPMIANRMRAGGGRESDPAPTAGR